MKKIFTLASCFAMILTLVACSVPTNTATGEPAKESSAEAQQEVQAVPATIEGAFQGDPSETYYMCNMVSGIEYWVPVYEMFKQNGRQLGVKTVYLGTPEYDVNAQIAVFEQILAMDPAGIFLHPVNADAFVEPINRAIAMGIPVVTFAADSPNSNRQCYITSDNKKEGEFAADTFGEMFGGEGEVAVLENPSQDNHALRISAFVDRLAEKWPNVKVVARDITNQDTNKAYQSTLSMIQANPNLKGIFMPEASSAMGAGQAVKESGKDIKVLCCDVNEQVLNLIKDGTIWGSLNPNQGVQGYMGMMMLYMSKHPSLIDPMTNYIAEGTNPVSMSIDNGLTLVTANNADAFYLDKYLARRNSKGIEE